MKLLTRKRHFIHRLSMLGRVITKAQIFVFGSKIASFQQKNLICLINGHFSWNLEIYLKIATLSQKRKFVSKSGILAQNCTFVSKKKLCLKIGHFGSKLELCLKIETLSQNRNFVSKLGILAQNWNFVSSLANFPEKRQIGLKMIRRRVNQPKWLITFSIVLKMSFFGKA